MPTRSRLALVSYCRSSPSTRRAIAALRITIGAAGTACAQHEPAPPAVASPSSRLMPDGKQWLTENLSLAAPGSSCYQGDARM